MFHFKGDFGSILKNTVSEHVPNCKVTISTATVRSMMGRGSRVNGKSANKPSLSIKTNIVDNTNITSWNIGINGLHLNFSGQFR